ncbi:hypothetical protein KX928_15925 [Roseobacter sp. YSTF-M11]|uniref:Uncharacterized protein n=1 Tax=Roseobacter insulae TaxID=2859783 RepID=A0A9X1FWD8_9RHOB|nr:hypothetical protein [Roseobacter insulae]MBW4709280.1 hypothetical protein [Roseobacter insulae]
MLTVEAKNLPRSLPPQDATCIKTRFRVHPGPLEWEHRHETRPMVETVVI